MGLSRPNAWSTTRTLILDPLSPGNVVDTARIRTLARSPGTVGPPRGASDQDLIQVGQLVDPGPL